MNDISDSIEGIELKYTADHQIDVDYYIERARAERSAYIAHLVRKMFFKKAEKSGKARVSYNLQQSPAH